MWCFRINKTPHTGFLPQSSCRLLGAEGMGCLRQEEALHFLLPGKIVLVCCLFWLCSSVLSASGRPEPEIAKAYFEIAQAYTDTEKYDKAAEFYQKAAKDPEHKNAAEFNLARVYGLQGDWKKARPILERQYAQAPGNVLLLKAYAYSLAATGKHSRAIEMYRKLYEDDKENPDSALSYARILVFTKRYDEAQTFINELKTVFAETNEKKVLDELEEQIKKALEKPEKEATLEESTAAKPEAEQTAGTEDIPPAEKGDSPAETVKPETGQPAPKTGKKTIPVAEITGTDEQYSGKPPSIAGKETAAQNAGKTGITEKENNGAKNK